MPIIAPRAERIANIDAANIRGTSSASVRDAWSLLTLIGIAFFLLGMADIALGWIPAAFGNPEWEFGTISGSLNALTIPMIGVYLVAASAIARADRRSGRVVGLVMGVMGLFIIGLGVVYLTVAPIALKAVAGSPLVLVGMQKAVGKALLLGTAYVALLAVGAVKTWRIRPIN